MARVRLEKRRGKPVTVIALSGDAAAEADAIARELRSALSVGGTAKPSDQGVEIELQGDHRPRVRERLEARGITVKGA